jgi:hypothetical protein
MDPNLGVLLTPKQQAFCDEYLVDRNATAAALRAGYARSIALNGYLMTIPKIKQYLKNHSEAAAEKAQVSHDMILRELCKIAFGNMRDYFLPEGGLKPAHELTDDQAAALWSTSITDSGSGGGTQTITKIRMYNKLTALDKIAKHLNFYQPGEQRPEKEYVYLDKAKWCEDDHYGEDEDDDEEDYDYDEQQLPDVEVGADGNILCDSEGALKFKLNPDESYDENLARLEVYEDRLCRPIKEAWMDAHADSHELPLFMEIVNRLRGVGAHPDVKGAPNLGFKFMLLREMQEIMVG